MIAHVCVSKSWYQQNCRHCPTEEELHGYGTVRLVLGEEILIGQQYILVENHEGDMPHTDPERHGIEVCLPVTHVPNEVGPRHVVQDKGTQTQQ